MNLFAVGKCPPNKLTQSARDIYSAICSLFALSTYMYSSNGIPDISKLCRVIVFGSPYLFLFGLPEMMTIHFLLVKHFFKLSKKPLSLSIILAFLLPCASVS